MLDAQRYRESSLYAEYRLTRAIFLTHLVLGILVVILLLLHGVYPWAAAAFAWYTVTLATLGGMTKLGALRILMGALFLLFSVGGIYFLTQVAPRAHPQTPPSTGQTFLSIWLGLANLAYAVGGVFILVSARVKKVTGRGFSLR